MGTLISGSDVAATVVANSSSFLTQFAPAAVVMVGVGIFAAVVVVLRSFVWRG